MTKATKASTSALSSKNYRTYLFGSIFSLLGIWIQRLAIGWHAWQLSQSAVIVGIVAAVQFLPILVLSPLFGVLADRIQPRRGNVVLNAMMLSVATLLGIITLSGSMTTGWLIALALTQGVIVSAYTPVRLALMPDLVPQPLFSSAVATSSIAFNLSRFAGPVIAGWVVTWYGLGWAYLINAITYLPVILSLCLLDLSHAQQLAKLRRPYLEELVEGLRYVRSHPLILQAILLAGVSAFFGRGVLELMPAFSALVFKGGSNALATLMSAAGGGAILGSFAMSTAALQARLPHAIVIGTAGVALALLLFGQVHSLHAGIAAIAFLGLSATTVGVGSQALVQTSVENSLRGRVMSLWTLLSFGAPAIGSVLGGILTRTWGAAATVVTFSLCAMLLVTVLVVTNRIRVNAAAGNSSVA